MRTDTRSISVPTASLAPVFTAAMASTPVPAPTSSTFLKRLALISRS